MGQQYAAGSEVSVARSRTHLEQLLQAHGAQGFSYGWTSEFDRVEFLWRDRQIRFTLPRPKRDRHVLTPSGLQRSEKQVTAAIEAEDRRRWRALLLVVRAKIEAVEGGITEFEQEFLAFIVMPNDQTIGEILVPRLSDGTIAKRLLPPGQQPQ